MARRVREVESIALIPWTSIQSSWFLFSRKPVHPLKACRRENATSTPPGAYLARRLLATVHGCSGSNRGHSAQAGRKGGEVAVFDQIGLMDGRGGISRSLGQSLPCKLDARELPICNPARRDTGKPDEAALDHRRRERATFSHVGRGTEFYDC